MPNIVDPGAFSRLLAPFKSPDADIGDLEEKARNIADQLAALKAHEDDYDSPAFQWLVNTFLPTELRRIEHARSELDPTDTTRQCMVQGQINEISLLTTYLGNVRATAWKLERQLKQIRKKIRRKTQEHSDDA